MRKLIFVLLAGFLFTGCAKDYYTSVDSDNGATGVAQIEISKPISGTLTMNGDVVAESNRTKRIVVESIPIGEHTFSLVGSGNYTDPLDKEFILNIAENDTTTHVVGGPRFNAGKYFLVGVLPALLVIAIMN